MDKTLEKPSWDRLYETGAGQDGHFTTAQAAAAGYSPQLLAKHLANRRIRRVRRGVYRLVHFPAGEHEDLVVLWLWTDRVGVFSHETALALHELSDVLPAEVHMTVPESWRGRRLRTPKVVVLHYSDLPDREQVFAGDVPVTSAARTLIDCVRAELEPDLVRQALSQGLARGLYARRDVHEVERYLARFRRAAR